LITKNNRQLLNNNKNQIVVDKLKNTAYNYNLY